ncbi:hypothetical protein [uncultured Sphingomonas sp.]|uniref:hypothetical protein n=1 Tax=uncultured Sphingomonas sp. TaxID=158754 RepID=UPI0025FCD067|nr:hypothetical protein [uncultured Sphingomonas sp.]
MGTSQYRAVTVAPGHTLNVRKAPQQTDRPGFVTVTGRHRSPFDVKTSLWNEAPISNA